MKLDFLNTFPYVCAHWQEIAQKDPGATFLTEESSDLSYTCGKVDELSARVYSWLSAKGVGTEDFVLIRLPRDARPFIAMLGVWKAGAAFTVVEDTYAPERIEAIRADCGCRLEIDEAAWEEILKTEPKTGFKQVDDHDASFAIYTSGSTGRPKGVLQEYGKIKLTVASAWPLLSQLINEHICLGLVAPLNFIAALQLFLYALYSGMRLVVISTETARNPVQLNARFERYQVNTTFLSPSILRVMPDGLASSLKLLVTGSEPANGLFFEGVRMINVYDLSEAGFVVSMFEVDKRYDITPIGRPASGEHAIRLLDESGKEVPDGQEGEICFDNPFFRGYIHLPEETAKAMRDGVFHSGDMGKRLPDGNIVVTGRLSTMVKINGNRVEPGEIEAAMRKIPGIKNAAVRDFEGERQQVFLCAYYVCDDDPGEDSIRAQLQRTLPHYMIPAFFTRLKAIPLNSNGKVDRFALPRPDANARTRAYVAPGTPEEAAICAAFEKVLHVDKVGADDDFFELGGDSLATALAASALESLRVDYRDIYAWRTPRQIAAHLSEKGEVDLDALNRAALQRDQYLTPYQTFYYDAILYSPTQTETSNPVSFQFPRSAVEPERLKAALEAVFANYAVFSTVLSHDEAGVPVFRYVPGKIVHPEIHEAEHTEDTLKALIQPYCLHDELLYRCAIHVTKEYVYLDWDICHIIGDGTCIANFMSELFAAYRGQPLKPDHYYWYLENQYKRRMELEREADARLLMERYNRPDYRRNPEPDLSSRRTGNGQYYSATTLTRKQIQSGSQALGTSLNALYVAATLITLSKISGDSKVTVEWIFNGRDEAWEQDLVGLTIASVPVAVDMANIHTPRDLLKEIDTQSILGMRYADLSLGNSGVTPGPRDRMVLIHQSGFDVGAVLPKGTVATQGYEWLNGAVTRMQIILYPCPDPDAVNPLIISYDSELYSEALVQRICGYYNEALEWMISGSDQ